MNMDMDVACHVVQNAGVVLEPVQQLVLQLENLGFRSATLSLSNLSWKMIVVHRPRAHSSWLDTATFVKMQVPLGRVSRRLKSSLLPLRWAIFMHSCRRVKTP